MSTHRYILRAVIEFTTPFLVATGRKEEVADAEFVKDPNGLPMLPGTSIAGVLRAAFEERYGEERTNELFGFQKNDDGSGSKLVISSGCMHNSADKPMEGIIDFEAAEKDEVLIKAQTPILRDHVRINHKGASDSDKNGKFDEYAVCAGNRFTFECEMSGSEDDKTLWDDFVSALCTMPLRFGGSTRKGYGACRIVSLKSRIFNLKEDFEDYAKHPVSLAAETPMPEKLNVVKESKPNGLIKLKLKANGFWMFGGGSEERENDDSANPPDMAPVRDSLIVWDNGRGAVRNNVVLIPGSSVKGALSHRTAFHYNAMHKIFADDLREDEFIKHCGENNGAVKTLFGCAKGNDENETPHGGRVMIDDTFILNEPKSKFINHVGIDRYTGGAMDQVLFNERPFYEGEFELNICVSQIEEIEREDKDALVAFGRALKDLLSGKLQLGAGGGRGIGYFSGEIVSVCDKKLEEILK